MIHIVKSRPPKFFIYKARRIKASRDWKTCNDIKKRRGFFNRFPKKELRAALIEEQHGLCAYCMDRLVNDGHKMTIEHYVPLCLDKNKSIDYYNMLGVCNGGREIDGSRRCCDASRKRRTRLTIDPRKEGHIRSLAYRPNGFMYADSGEPVFNRKVDKDINEELHLNGWGVFGSENWKDTSTYVVEGRRTAYKRYLELLKRLGPNQVNRHNLQMEIDKILKRAYYPAFAGVLLFFLRRRLKNCNR